MSQDSAKLQYLVTGAHGFLGKYVMRELNEILPDSNAQASFKEQVTTLGLSDICDIHTNLLTQTPDISRRYDVVIHLCGSCHDGDLEALNVTTTRNLLAGLEATPPGALVYVSSTEVYGRSEGTDLGEGTIPEPVTPCGIAKLQTEKILTDWCNKHGVILSILRCPDIVGTGMKGFPRRMAHDIYRAIYQHIEDETACVSTVHAVDVAYVAVNFPNLGGIFNLTDGCNPSRRDLAEAIAVRIDNKRIFTLRPRRARILARIGDFLPFTGLNSKTLTERYTSLTFSADKIAAAIDRPLTSVTHYLRNHVYDENSL